MVLAGSALLCGKDERGVLAPVSVGAVKNTEQKRVTCEWRTLDVHGKTMVYMTVHELSTPGAACCHGAGFGQGPSDDDDDEHQCK